MRTSTVDLRNPTLLKGPGMLTKATPGTQLDYADDLATHASTGGVRPIHS